MKLQPKTTIEYAEWPRDAPSALERNIITIVCGNSRLHWALHEGSFDKFIPIMFWHTAHDGDGDEASYEEGEPCGVLDAHIASQAHALIFGDDENPGSIHYASQSAAKRDAPGISVFVVSSNPRVEKKICHMFQGVPAKIFKLRNTDFFTPEQGVYPTMGVDRVAALHGANLHFGSPILVIDGGTAMTYSVLDENSHIVGGGISPGVKIRLQSLADYTGSLPMIDHKRFKSLVEGAIAAKTPLPFFAKDTEMAMVSPVCGELACQLRNIVKQFVTRYQPSPPTSASTSEGEATAEVPSEPKILPVIITGGDGKFLQDLLESDASGIVSVEPDVSPVPTNIDVKHVKNLVAYALGDIINKKYSGKPMNPEEKLKLKIQGLRIAASAIDEKEIFTRGCVFNITPELMIEGYMFHARFDNGIQKDLTLRELYDCLALYNEIGEKASIPGALQEVDKEWVTEKKMWSKKVQEELGNISRSIRNRMRELKPYVEKGELHKIFKRRHVQRASSAKRAKRSVDNPEKYLGKRIAKLFPIEEFSAGADSGNHVFFGTVRYLSDPQLLWYFIQYDDGDMEDIGLDEVLEGIDLYEQHKHNDSMHEQHDALTPSQPKSVLPVGRKPNCVFLHTDTAEGTVYTNLTDLLDSSAVDVSIASGNRGENSRMISEFKEDL